MADPQRSFLAHSFLARALAALAAFAQAWRHFGEGAAAALVPAAPEPDLLSVNAGTLVVIARRDGRIDRANPAFRRVYGSRTSIAHLLDTGNADPDTGPDTDAGPTPGARLDRVPAEDGRRLEISWIFTPLSAERWGEAALLGLGHDCTGERAAEIALLQSTRLLSLGEITSGLVHEINQPLNVIGLALANIRRRLEKGETDTARLVESLTRAENNVARARTLVSHLRALGRSKALAHGPLDLREVVEASLSLLAHSLRQLGIEVLVELAPDAVALEADPTLLGQILLNLLTNARDAIEAGTAPEDARWIRVDASRSGGRVAISIADSGGGIPQSLAERIFEPFFSTRTTGTRAGLGLALCRTMARDLHGTLSFHNAGPGAVFVLALPASNPQG